MPTSDYRFEVVSKPIENQPGIIGINAEIVPSLRDGCKVKFIVNGVEVTGEKQEIGNILVFNFTRRGSRVALRIPVGQPPPRIQAIVECPEGDSKVFDSSDRDNPKEATRNFLDKFLDFLKDAADTLAEGFKKFLPEEFRKKLKEIKGLIGKGIDVVTNLLPGAKAFAPLAPFLLLFPDNLEHLKKKIGEQLKELDPLDDSPEAALADAAALRALILEDIIPFVQQVGNIATKDLELYTQRVSVMNKMTARLSDQLQIIKVPTKKLKRKK